MSMFRVLGINNFAFILNPELIYENTMINETKKIWTSDDYKKLGLNNLNFKMWMGLFLIF